MRQQVGAIDAGLSECVEHTARTIDGILCSFPLSPTEFEQVRRLAYSELERDVAKAGQRAAVVPLLPVIQRQSLAFFRAKRVREADELVNQVLVKTWNCACRQGIRENARALVTTICKSVFVDHVRTKLRLAARVRHGDDALTQVPDAPDLTCEAELLERFIDGLPFKCRLIIRARRLGLSWLQVAELVEMTVGEAVAAVRQIEWPGGLS